MKTNPTHPGTYAGQPARILLAVTTSAGRDLYVLRTAGGVVATEWDTAEGLRLFARKRGMQVTK